MTVKIINGDLLSASEDILGHQVNCQGVMGSGVAMAIRAVHKEAYVSYVELSKSRNPKDLLGSCQIVKTEYLGKIKYIANLFGQLDYGRSLKVYTNYEALRSALTKLKEIAMDNNLTVALPYNIGCGLANGDWDVVYPMIEEVFKDYEVTLYKI